MRAFVAIAALALVLVVNTVAIEANAVFLTVTHAPLLLIYVFALSSAVSSLAGAIALIATTSLAWAYAAAAEQADDRAFVPLTHWFLWTVGLIGSALLGAAASTRRARRHPR